jgi:pimeloyl-ACP methyl ester carboxylesterase
LVTRAGGYRPGDRTASARIRGEEVLVMAPTADRTAMLIPSADADSPPRVTFLPCPPWWLTVTDLGRASMEAVTWQAVRHLLRGGGHGDGRPVLVLPGFLTGDLATRTLRAYLRERGFHTHRWTLGLNRGFTDAILEGLVERLDELHTRHGRPVAIVGWSLGGLMARWLAHVRPDAVERIICLGSPWRPEAEQNRVTEAFRAAERHWGFSADTEDVLATLRRPVPVRSVAVYSPWDGILHGDGCRQDDGDLCENVVVPGSHCGLCHNPAALVAIADRLEVPLDDWRPFRWSEALSGGFTGGPAPRRSGRSAVAPTEVAAA